MAKPSRRRPPAHRPLSVDPNPIAVAPHAWHVVLANGADATITAHEAECECGALTFYDRELDSQIRYDRTLVRAFAATAWSEVELVVVPAAPEPADA
jgi:hypothetical protein